MLASAEQANARVYPILSFQEPLQAPDALIYNEAFSLSYVYDVPQQFIPELATLINNGVLGKKATAEKWSNIGEHCILAGKMALPTAWLAGLTPSECLRITQQAYIHDAHLRREKESKAQSVSIVNGMKRVEVGTNFYYEHEMAHPGILQATSMDWRGYENWPPELQIMRYVDSCVGPVILPDGTSGNDELQHYSLRTHNLHTRKQKISDEIGRQWYNGIPAFKYLQKVTEDIETSLHQAAIQTHPEIMLHYPHPCQFFNAVYDQVYAPPVNWSEYLPCDTLST